MKKFLSVLLGLILCVGSLGLVGCGEEGETPTSSDSTPQVTADSKVGKVNPFDSQKQLSSLQMFGYLGRAELNDDAAYIKEGTGSMKVTVSANPIANESPYLFQGLNQTTIARANYTNFDYVSHVVMDVYSAEKETTRIGLRLIYKYDSWGDTKQSIITWFDVQPGWNSLQYAPGREYITLNGDGIRFVEAIGIVFERGENDRVYYLDDLKQYKTTVPPSTIVTQLAENEICSFDYMWQAMALGNLHWVSARLQPVVEHNTDPKYTATGLGGSLKLTFPADTKEDNAWPGVIIPESSIGTVDFSAYDDNDLLCIDAYTPTDKAVTNFTVLLLGSEMSQVFFQYTHRMQAGTWNTIKLSVGQIRKETKGNLVAFEDMKNIELTTSSRTIQTQLYFDNIRMEVVD